MRKLNNEALAIAAKKLRRMRIETIGGFKERPARTIHYILQRGGDDLVRDDEFTKWLIGQAIQYYEQALTAAESSPPAS